ncbi:MAG: Uncharacterized protein Athens071426_420, partial [Parcubacteria group bacterium Athens0714_26]
ETPSRIVDVISNQFNSLAEKTNNYFIDYVVGYFKPLQISDVKAMPLSSTSAQITWTTNHSATSKVNYGATREYDGEFQNAQKVKKHQVFLENLKPNTLYHYEVMSQNKSDYAYDADRIFQTLK